MKKIFIVGMPGSGKSTMAKYLSSETSFKYLDLDEEIKTDDFLELFEDSGWMINSRYCIPIHSSLARQLIIATAD